MFFSFTTCFECSLVFKVASRIFSGGRRNTSCNGVNREATPESGTWQGFHKLKYTEGVGKSASSFSKKA